MDQRSALIELPDPQTPSTDWFLQQFADWANEQTLEFGVTLQVGGLVITGTLISGREYFNGVAEQLAEAIRAAEDQQSSRVPAGMEAFAGHFPDRVDPRSIVGEDAGPTDDPEFIHLRDAKWFAGSQPLPGGASVYWRGRVASIDGFMLGTAAPGGLE